MTLGSAAVSAPLLMNVTSSRPKPTSRTMLCGVKLAPKIESVASTPAGSSAGSEPLTTSDGVGVAVGVAVGVSVGVAVGVSVGVSVICSAGRPDTAPGPRARSAARITTNSRARDGVLSIGLFRRFRGAVANQVAVL